MGRLSGFHSDTIYFYNILCQAWEKNKIQKNLIMKRCFFIVLYILFSSYTNALASKVAVFDFDDRLNQEHTTAKYLENRLKQADKDILVYQFSGKGEVKHSVNIMKKLDNAGYNLIIIITSDALIIANHVIKKTPVLFTNVNNPLSLGLSSLEAPGGNITGASYYVSIAKQLILYKSILSNLKTMGFIFDKNNKSKKVELPEVRKACKKLGIEPAISVVSHHEELNAAAKQLIEEGIDALSIGSSGMLYNNIPYFIDICNQNKIPIFSFNKKGVKQGAVAALSSDYNLMVDKLIIPMALKILRGSLNPGDTPVAFLDDNLIFVNLNQAEKLNLKIPQSTLKKAIIIH